MEAGALPLDPEKSRNYSAGTVVRFGGFSLTVDGYHIRIRDQIALSENIQATASTQVGNLLAPFRVQAARFFINGLDTTTQGVDVVGTYRLRLADLGSWSLSAAYNYAGEAMVRNMLTEDTLNGMDAFIAKQPPPVWKGR